MSAANTRNLQTGSAYFIDVLNIFAIQTFAQFQAQMWIELTNMIRGLGTPIGYYLVAVITYMAYKQHKNTERLKNLNGEKTTNSTARKSELASSVEGEKVSSLRSDLCSDDINESADNV